MIAVAIWTISLLAIGGVILRPYHTPEAWWAVCGALLLVICRLLPVSDALKGAGKGVDVYLFLTGMMLLAEAAREEKLFDWLAVHATNYANGSGTRLFLLIYLVGILVTTFMSNDATAVVLTPAVAAAMRTARVKNPLPYLFICAFIANAASFVLPISNPANLVIYGKHTPSLLQWLPRYFIPAVMAITSTYILLFVTQRKYLDNDIAGHISSPALSHTGKLAMWGIIVTGLVLLVSSAYGLQLGLPTAITGIITATIITIAARKSPVKIIKQISWSVLALVAGLFVIVEALNTTGLTLAIGSYIHHAAGHSVAATSWISGIAIAFLCNLINNLPAGLITGSIMQTPHTPEMIKSAALIGIDLGPNLSVTGSLATILWLVALGREGIRVKGWNFLKLGFIVMIIPLLITLATLWLMQ